MEEFEITGNEPEHGILIPSIAGRVIWMGSRNEICYRRQADATFVKNHQGLGVAVGVKETDVGVCKNRGTPSHHPFRTMGFSLTKTIPRSLRVPPWLWKPQCNSSQSPPVGILGHMGPLWYCGEIYPLT